MKCSQEVFPLTQGDYGLDVGRAVRGLEGIWEKIGWQSGDDLNRRIRGAGCQRNYDLWWIRVNNRNMMGL